MSWAENTSKYIVTCSLNAGTNKKTYRFKFGKTALFQMVLTMFADFHMKPLKRNKTIGLPNKVIRVTKLDRMRDHCSTGA